MLRQCVLSTMLDIVVLRISFWELIIKSIIVRHYNIKDTALYIYPKQDVLLDLSVRHTGPEHVVY